MADVLEYVPNPVFWYPCFAEQIRYLWSWTMVVWWYLSTLQRGHFLSFSCNGFGPDNADVGYFIVFVLSLYIQSKLEKFNMRLSYLSELLFFLYIFVQVSWWIIYINFISISLAILEQLHLTCFSSNTWWYEVMWPYFVTCPIW